MVKSLSFKNNLKSNQEIWIGEQSVLCLNLLPSKLCHGTLSQGFVEMFWPLQ